MEKGEIVICNSIGVIDEEKNKISQSWINLRSGFLFWLLTISSQVAKPNLSRYTVLYIIRNRIVKA